MLRTVLRRTMRATFLYVCWLSISCDTSDDLESLREKVFIKLYGGRGTEIGQDIKLLPDGGFVLLGNTTSFSNSRDIYVVRTDPAGNPIWQYSYDYNDAGFNESGQSIEIDPNGDIVICGWVDTEVGGSTRDVLVMKLDSEGTLLAARTYGNLGGSDQDEAGSHILRTSNGDGYFVTATHYDQNTNNSWFYSIRLDPNLDENQPYADIARRYFGGQAGHVNIAVAAVHVPDIPDLFYLFGTTSATGANVYNPNVPGGTNFYLYRWQADNHPQTAEHFLGSDENDVALTFKKGSTDRQFVLGGYRESLLGISKRGSVLFVSNKGTHLNPLFDVEWSWVDDIFTTGANTRSQVESAIQVSDGSVVALLTIENYQRLQSGNHFGLVKIIGDAGSTAQLVWNTTFGSSEDDKASEIIELEDGSLVVIGTVGYPVTTSDVVSDSKMAMYKLSSSGLLIPE